MASSDDNDISLPRNRRRLWWRVLILLAVALLFLPVVTWIAIDQLGKAALRNAIEALKADGEPVEPSELVTVTRDQVPDADNFCALPWLRTDDLLARSATREAEEDWDALYHEATSGFHQWAYYWELPPFQYHVYPEEDLPEDEPADQRKSKAVKALRTLNRLENMWTDLEQARNRPHAHYLPLLADRIDPEALGGVNRLDFDFNDPRGNLALMARHRAREALDAGENETALRSIEVGFRIVDGYSATCPSRSSSAEVTGTFSLICDAVLHGFSTGVFAEDAEALRRVEVGLQRLDFPTTLESNLRMMLINDRAFFNGFAEKRFERSVFLEPEDPTSRTPTYAPFPLAMINSAPGGWFHGHTAELIELLNADLLPALRKKAPLGEVAAAADAIAAELNSRTGLRKHGTFPLIKNFPRYQKECEIFLLAEAIRRQILIACCLHRYRIDHHNEWPTTLDALVPDYLPAVPKDPIDGAPMRYHLVNEEGQQLFLLYSIGRDRIDDHGEMKLPHEVPDGTALHNGNYPGDWTFPLPPERR